MKTRKNQKTTQKPQKPNDAGDNLSDAAIAARFGVSQRTVRRWRRDGAPLDDVKAMEQWLSQRRQLPDAALPGLREARLQEVQERVRRLRLQNDQTEGALVPRSWICSKIAIMCGELKCLEHRSLEEHPLRLAAAGHDVAQCRSVLRGVWGELHDMLQSLGESLKEEDPE